MLPKSLQIVLCFALLCPASGQTIPPEIFENYKRGADQFIAVINYLLAGVDTENPVKWAQQLQSDVHAVPAPFQMSLSAAESKQTELDISTLDLIVRTGAIEQQISQLESTINAEQELVKNCENEVSTANVHVQNAENSLATANSALRQLEEKLRKAREECLGRRRKRCSSLDCIFVGEINKAVCGLINEFTGSIDKAKNRRNDAIGAHDIAVNQLNQRKTILSEAKLKLTVTQQELTNRQTELIDTNQQLNDVRAQIVAIDIVNQGLKSVIVHVDRILVGSNILKQFVEDLSLIDLNTLIEPLEHIGNELTSRTPGTEALHFTKLSPDQVASINSSLKTLSDVLPNEDIISNEEKKVV